MAFGRASDAPLAPLHPLRRRQADPQGLRLDRRRPVAAVRHRLGRAGCPVVACRCSGGQATGCAHGAQGGVGARERSEEHTSELQSLMRISYAVFCLKKKNNTTKNSSNANKEPTDEIE